MLDSEMPGTEAGHPKTVLADGSDNTKSNRTRKGILVAFGAPDDPQFDRLSGRLLWALRELVAAGPRGVTPIERPAPRWSHYVHQLRDLGLTVETIREPHGGAYPGSHGRYVLHGWVQIGGAE